jgi:hypothetical protein
MASFFWTKAAGGGTGTWDAVTTTNWASSSGGAGGVGVPGVSDTVTFDANSFNAITDTCTVNTNFSVTSITCGAMGGILDFSANNNSPTMQTFNCSGTGTRTLNLGNGTFTITGASATVWNIGTTTSLTDSFASATIKLTGANAAISVASRTYGSFQFTGGGTMVIGGSATMPWTALTVTGVGNGDNISINQALTLSGALIVTGASSVNTLNVKSAVAGTLRAITHASTSSALSNATWTDISLTFNGPSNTWTLSEALNLTSATAAPVLTLTAGTFNANNFNVTCGIFSSSNSNTRVLTMGSGTWTLTGNAATIWSMATGTGLTINIGTTPVNCTYSGSTGTRTIACAGARGPNFLFSAGSDTVAGTGTSTIGSLNFTGFTGAFSNANSFDLLGSLTLGTGMSVTSTASSLRLSGTGSHTITTNNVQINLIITQQGVGGTYTLQDNLDMSGASLRALQLNNGTFNANNFNVTCGSFSSSNSNTRSLLMGTGTWTLTGTGTVWTTATTTGLTLTAGTSTIKITDASASSKTIATGNGLTFGNLWLTGGGTGTMIIGTAANTQTFANIQVDPALTVQFFAGSTTVVSSITWSGTASLTNTFQSTTNGTAWTISAPSGVLSADYISLQDSTATGGATFLYGANSTNVSGNTGWNRGKTLDYSAGANGTLTGTTHQVIVSGTNGTTVTAKGNTGYQFNEWNDFGGGAIRQDHNVDHDITVSASFVPYSTLSTFTKKHKYKDAA